MRTGPTLRIAALAWRSCAWRSWPPVATTTAAAAAAAEAGRRGHDAEGRRDPDRRRGAALPRHQEGLLRGGEPDDRAAARRGRRGDHPVGDVRRLPDRLLEHDVAADRRVEEPAGPDHLPGRARRHQRGGRVGRVVVPEGQRRQGRRRTSRARRSRSTRSTTSARHDQQRRWRRTAPTTRRSSTSRCRSRTWARRSRPSAWTRRSRSSRPTRAARPAGGTASSLLRGDRAEPHRRDLLRVQAVHRRERRRRPALQARDGEVARVRGAERGRGARGGRRVHADPAGGDRQDHLPTWRADLNEPTIQLSPTWR